MRRQVEAWVDGELSGPAALNAYRHLEKCWGCSSDAELLRLLKVALAGLARREPSTLAATRLRRWAMDLDPGPLR